MGKAAHVAARFADGPDEGRLQYEPPKLIFRGAARRVFVGDSLAGVRADGPDLLLADGSRFALGHKPAAAARAVGLVDNKVVGFSDTLTALRFVRRRT